MRKKYKKSEEYQVFHHVGENTVQGLIDFVGNAGNVFDYLTGGADISLSNSTLVVRVPKDWYVVKGNKGSWGAYPLEEFVELFEEEDTYKEWYMFGHDNGEGHAVYDMRVQMSDINTIDDKLEDVGYEFEYQDDGGYLYKHVETGKDLWVTHVYKGNGEV